MTEPHILIIGAGIAGSTCAYWLGRANIRVTVIERAAQLSKYGQGIDAEGPARDILEKMGVVEEMRRRHTGEEGFAVVNDDGKQIGTAYGVLTSDIEIMRGDFAQVLYDAANSMKSVDYVFGRKVAEIDQQGDRVAVKFEDGTQAEYTAVIGADGLRSHTRQTAFDAAATKDCFIARDHYAAFFQLPYEDSDYPLCRWQNATNGRVGLIRPCNKEASAGLLMHLGRNDRLAEVCFQSRQAQKEAVRDLFADVGGIIPRAVEGMMTSEDFYFERLAQIKMKKWHNGRVALVGDAAYAPSPVTGSGTKCAIVGAYHLAGELSRQPNHPEAAFEAYDRVLRPFINKMQTISLWGYGPMIVYPATSWGIWLQRLCFSWIAWSALWKQFDSLQNTEVKVPDYPGFGLSTVPKIAT